MRHYDAKRLFGDEANTPECMSGAVDETHPKCAMVWHVEGAWNRLVRAGVIRWHACSKPLRQQTEKRDILCLWSYANLTARDTEEHARRVQMVTSPTKDMYAALVDLRVAPKTSLR